MVSLQTLYLYDNQLTGSLPPSWGNMTSLQTLDLSSNELTGSLPASWSNMTSLLTLLLSANELTGSLPPSWGNMTSLQSLYLYYNQLTGSLPPLWGNMSNLQDLYLNINEFTGSLPSSWSNMTSLWYLYLNSNQLTGSLPSSWSNMAKMYVLYLDSNQITGSLPSSWSNMTRLKSLHIYSNKLNGSLPPSWGNIIRVQTLWLSTNQLTGSLPPSWGNMTSLQELWLDSNQFTGSLPPSWGNMTEMRTLQLNSNQLTGSLPPSWSNMTKLGTFNLTSNYLTSTVPSGWWRRFISALSSNCLDPPASNQRPALECRFSSTFADVVALVASRSQSETRDIALLLGDNTASKSLKLLSPFMIDTSAIITVNAVTIATMTIALVGGGSTTGMPSLQGAVGAMRLAYRCSSEKGVDDVNKSPPPTGDPSSESTDNPLGIVLPSCPPELAAAGGAIIGNSVLVAVIAVASHALVKVRRMRWKLPSRFRARARMLGSVLDALVPSSLLPGSVVIGHAVLLQPTIRAAVVSIGGAARTAGTISIGLAGVLLCVVPGVLLWWKISRLRLTMKPLRETQLVPVNPARALSWVAEPRWQWRSVCTDTLPQYGIVIEAHNRRWYFLVEQSLAAAGGVVLGASWVADDACSAAVWGTSFTMPLAVVEMILCVWLRPHVARLEAGVIILVCLLSIVVHILILVGLDAEAGGVATVSSALTYVPMLMGVVLVARPALRSAFAILLLWRRKYEKSKKEELKKTALLKRPARSGSARSPMDDSMRQTVLQSQPSDAATAGEALVALIELACQRRQQSSSFSPSSPTFNN